VSLLWASVLWVFASVATAMLPMRYQYIPGITLLIAAPVLIFLIGSKVGWWFGLLALAAFVSMYRNPLRYFWAGARGHKPDLPK
jgi:hypothetical protein